ncbi:AAA family ATPase [Citrobacter sp. S2-9]|uniref:AAA family ATPase n=1 Tax=Citrobacter enshiensis TaxID=2971264 RepID=A0ABT8PV85_9ENTR|nr:AAA family ATPase [Citrobacter enshiensis]MDN8600270.1 AAA family ATPase [Citrobacter enshiensis]
MKIALSGTYSSGKTFTAMTLSYYSGVPRLLSKAIREIMPGLMPGKRLADVSPEEFLHLMIVRHIGRVKSEIKQNGSYISDGSSLQELLYGEARLIYGINPSADNENNDRYSTDIFFFARVLEEIGRSFKSHVTNTYDIFFHLKHELPLTADGHRPMNSDFRNLVDKRMLEVLNETGIPYSIISGSVESRVIEICEHLHLKPVMSISEAIERATLDYTAQDLRLEEERSKSLI